MYPMNSDQAMACVHDDHIHARRKRRQGRNLDDKKQVRRNTLTRILPFPS